MVSAKNAGDTIDLTTGLGLGSVLSYKSGEFETYIFAVYGYGYRYLTKKAQSQSGHSQSLGGSVGFNFWLNKSTALNLNVGMAHLIGGEILLLRSGIALLWKI